MRKSQKSAPGGSSSWPTNSGWSSAGPSSLLTPANAPQTQNPMLTSEHGTQYQPTGNSLAPHFGAAVGSGCDVVVQKHTVRKKKIFFRKNEFPILALLGGAPWPRAFSGSAAFLLSPCGWWCFLLLLLLGGAAFPFPLSLFICFFIFISHSPPSTPMLSIAPVAPGRCCFPALPCGRPLSLLPLPFWWCCFSSYLLVVLLPSSSFVLLGGADFSSSPCGWCSFLPPSGWCCRPSSSVWLVVLSPPLPLSLLLLLHPFFRLEHPHLTHAV